MDLDIIDFKRYAEKPKPRYFLEDGCLYVSIDYNNENDFIGLIHYGSWIRENIALVHMQNKNSIKEIDEETAMAYVLANKI